MAVQIQLRRGLASLWTSTNPILAEGEMGIETDTDLFKIGDGSTAWTGLGYANIASGITRTTVVTTTAPIIIDMASLSEVMFVGSASIGAAKTWSITNIGSAKLIPSLKFTMTTLDIQTFPSNFKMSDARWNSAAHTWTPLDVGTYEFSLTYDNNSATWLMTCIGGPYT